MITLLSVKTIHYAVPAMIVVAFSTYMMLTKNTNWSIGLALGIIVLVGLYTMKESIDWRYYHAHPPKLDSPILKLLAHVPFYKQLDSDHKIKFEQRLSLFMIAHEFQIPARGGADDDAPMEAQEDFKALSSISAILLTFEDDKFLISEIEKVILYHHPFPTPLYQFVHHSELNLEDKMIILSVPHVKKGVFEPLVYFDLSMYEWARSLRIPSAGGSWETFYKTYGVTKSQLEQSIGLPNPDLDAVQKVFDKHHSYMKLLS